MDSFLTNALQRKPLQLVRQQAHLSDDPSNPHSRYSAISILGSYGAGEYTAESILREADDANVHPRHPTQEAPMRHMSLFDLIAFGVGCTIGSGVFVLAGVAAHDYAGPSSSLSYLVAGIVRCPPASRSHIGL
jgi:amino acid permease